jgi:hypothetical protein
MKKLLFILSLSLFIFSSCKKVTQQVTQQVDQAFSAVYTIKASDWQTTDNGFSYFVNLSVPELSNGIYQDGAVLVYLSFSGDNFYEALPEVVGGFTYGVFHTNGVVGIDINAIDGSKITPPGLPVSAKVVLIDATRLALHKDVNLKNLQAVEKAFNIKN